MKHRVNYAEARPEALRAMMTMQAHVNHSGLEHELLELVKLRVSYMNGCAFCVDMHTKDARAASETEQRLYGLPVWRETPYYTERERAALEWAEAVASVGESRVPDDVYDRARAHFEESELVDLTMAVIAIGGWNRLAVAFRVPVGDYEPAGVVGVGS
ncbi:MAG: carboxymuconolactone decarboxylase family protein [Gemmatimonadota bacterium]